MKLEIDIPKHQYNNIMSLDSINLGRVPYKGIIMYAINAIKRGKTLEQGPTIKNDLAHNLCDSCTNIRCEFQSGIVRTKCAFYMPPQHLSGLEKNSKKLEKDFGELDCISRADAIQAMQDKAKKITNEDTINGLCGAVAILFDLPSVTPQEPRIITCSECKYYRDKGNKNTYCTKRLNVASVIDRYREPNFYCADAVLREVEE